MKTQLIILEQGNIIVSDEKCKIKDWCYNTYNKIYQLLSEHEVKTANDYIESKDLFKLIASDNPEHNLPKIDYNGLEKQFGIIDVEKLASKWYKDGDGRFQHGFYDIDSFIEGFKKAQELNDKKFSLEDINKIKDILSSPNLTDEIRVIHVRKYIDSLQQPKIFDVEIEMEKYHIWKKTGKIISGCDLTILQASGVKGKSKSIYLPKITNKSIKITKVL